MVAFVHCLEASTQDDALEVLEVILPELFGDAVKADRKSRLRSLKDLDETAVTLASACQMLLDDTAPGEPKLQRGRGDAAGQSACRESSKIEGNGRRNERIITAYNGKINRLYDELRSVIGKI